ncbi:conserved exported hypothetical protein [Cupriavidus taiwanensis]|uniref:CopM family metallochaperone n=1 Tax=Cupriavidus taiwanensis TaxID=164546 RepID=UPI000E153C65|nr:DUF305 domain-containing protein [Cupriavidus taiwanensis]SOZ20770.1 conserved exported hypothetical protein [Cupriavidus taiwanensis]SOZ33725.1 conserved exported hypothetical protein [Cupriavidus taiwanensis]SOZ48986.1 conserved exported hypothetical protein [Cupriavidus taiwanensis]SPA01566.1 conserved exported hypothetical protein [Cupriavidus taiwanensis]SPA23002.1 conserved exported hypothetical protein [Cupriavidus taiwanensis]
MQRSSLRHGAVAARALAALCLSAASLAAPAQNTHQHAQQHAHQPPGHAAAPPAFVASTAKPYAGLVDDAMGVMHHGMMQAPTTGNPDHDFVAMMIPHHQGAIDMAKALLLYGQDPALRNLAQGIITEQQNEIRLMQAWLQRHQARPSQTTPPR